MALNTSTLTSPAAGSTRRQPGPDVIRALALIGVVVMNYHGYLIIRGAARGDSWADDLFNPWTGPLATRFAATFVLVAGVGVTLLTRRTIGDTDRVTEMRWRLVRRGAVLYAGGLYLDMIWEGTIIPFYGAMFVIAAGMFTLRSRWILLSVLVPSGQARSFAPGGFGSKKLTRAPRGSSPRPRVLRRATSSTSSSTAPIRCFRGSVSSARASCWDACWGGPIGERLSAAPA